MPIMCCIIGVLACLVFYFYKKSTEITKQVVERNNKIIEENTKYEKEYSINQSKLNDLNEQLSAVQISLAMKQEQLQNEKDKIEEERKNKEKLMELAFANYFNELDKKYEEVTEDFDNDIKRLEEAYASRQIQLLEELGETEADLDKMKATREAAIAAQIKEEEIKADLSFYCLPLEDNDRSDILALERVKKQLSKPRILSMLIWSTYFQKPMTALCNRVIGTTAATGIYKITNQENQKCYIGQAVDIASRWKQHAKCGLGIDTPAGNKLYKDMIEFGIENFSWEILEECPKNQLNEKEKFYIDLYSAYDYGYNSTCGNS